MVEIICKEGQFLAKGSFFLGMAGTYVNKEFEEENILIEGTIEEIIEDVESEEPYCWSILLPYLEQAERNEKTIAQAITAYYNQKEEVKKNSKQINDCLLIHLFYEMCNCCYPFWEIKEAILPEKMTGFEQKQLETMYDNTRQEVTKIYKEFCDTPNNGSLSKTDAQKKLQELFPMFHFDGLIQSIIAESVVFEGRFINFQCSDGWNGQFLEGAYDSLDENFTSCDWA